MASINIELSHQQKKRFIDYRFTIVPPYECKNDCSWDYDCAHLEGFDEPHFCIHPSLAGRHISSISNFHSSESPQLSYLETSDSIISAEFITILLLVLLFACVLIIAHATWNHCYYSQKSPKKPLKLSQSCPITNV